MANLQDVVQIAAAGGGGLAFAVCLYLLVTQVSDISLTIKFSRRHTR